MAHNDYAIPSSNWASSTVLNASQLRKLDVAQSQMLGGDAGGTWFPAKPIIIGGAGLQTSGTSAFSKGAITGPNAAAGGALILGANDFPTFSTARTRVVVIPILDLQYASTDTISNANEAIPGSIVASASSFVFNIPSRYLPKGATISEIRVRMRVGSRPTSVPSLAAQPSISYAVYLPLGTLSPNNLYAPITWTGATGRALGDIIQPTVYNGYAYTCTTAGTSGGVQPVWPTVVGATIADGTATLTCGVSGGAMAPPASVDAYYNAGLTQDLVLVPNAGATIDTDSYFYKVAISDGCNTGNIYHALILTVTNITNLRPAV